MRETEIGVDLSIIHAHICLSLSLCMVCACVRIDIADGTITPPKSDRITQDI